MSILNDRFVSVSEAARIIGCTVSRVRQMLRGGDLSGEKLSQRVWVVDRRSAEKTAAHPSAVGRPRNGKT